MNCEWNGFEIVNRLPLLLIVLKFTLLSAIMSNPPISFNTAIITHDQKLYCKSKRTILKRISVIGLLKRDRLLSRCKQFEVTGYGMTYHFPTIILPIDFRN